MRIKTTSQILELVSNEPNKDALLYFAHQILKRNTNKDVYLSSQLLKKTFGDRVYKPIINQLVELGILEVLTNYRYNEYRFYTYKIKLPLSRKELISYEITDKKLIGRIEYILENNFEKLKPYIKQVLLNLESLVITPELLSELKKDGVQLEDEVFFTNNNEFKPRINQSKSGRVHHTLTNLNKKYRKKLTSTHGNLVEIDAKNAQLIFLSQLCPKDLAFKEDAFGGLFYDKLSKKMGIDITKQAVKDKFKKQFFNTILCNENKAVIANNKYANSFKSLYPVMFDFLIHLNQDSTKANKLQELESEFFITNILRDIVEMKLFAIPIHDALIVLEKDMDAVMSIINNHSIAFYNRYISTSIEHHTTCSTPCDFTLLIKERRRKKEANNNKCISSADANGVEQNKNQIKSQETVDKIKVAVMKLMEVGGKITIRKIIAMSGVSNASVNKHYKTILNDLVNHESESPTSTVDDKIKESETPMEVILNSPPKDSNEILNEFDALSTKYGFPKDIAKVFLNHINTIGFESIDEMIEEINGHPILMHLFNQRKIA